MTKKLTILLLTFFLIISGCKRKSTSENKNHSNITIKVDDRIQLLRLAYTLATIENYEKNYRPCQYLFYKNHYIPYEKYSNLPLVEKIKNGKAYRAWLPVLGLAFNKDLTPREGLDTVALKKHFGSWYGSHLDSLSKLMINFKEKTGFKNNYEIKYEMFRDSAEKAIKNLNPFFRTKEKYHLIIYFDPLNNIINRAIQIPSNQPDTRRILLANICDNPTADSIINKPLELKWSIGNRRVVIHESTHLYVGDFYDKYYTKEFDEYLEQKKFDDVYTNIQEIVVRGIVTKIIEINYGDEAGKYEISKQPDKSKIVYDYLDKYLANDKMTFEQAYKTIIKKLEESYNYIASR